MCAGICKCILAYGVVGVLMILYGVYIEKMLKAEADYFYYGGGAILIFGLIQICIYLYWRSQFTKYWQHKVTIETNEGKTRDLTLEEQVKLDMTRKSEIIKISG